MLTAALSGLLFSCLVGAGVIVFLGVSKPLEFSTPTAAAGALMIWIFSSLFAAAISLPCSIMGAAAFHGLVKVATWALCSTPRRAAH